MLDSNFILRIEKHEQHICSIDS